MISRISASPRVQWVFFGEDGAGPAEVLGEVQAQLLGAYAFIQVCCCTCTHAPLQGSVQGACDGHMPACQAKF